MQSIIFWHAFTQIQNGHKSGAEYFFLKLVTKVFWQVLEYAILKIQYSRLENGAWDQDGAKWEMPCCSAYEWNID